VNTSRVLIAEDHDDLRAMVVALLSSDYQIVGAVGDGEQLVQAALYFKPDVIVSDINMPRMTGFGARNELRSKGLDYPFVFMSILKLDEVLPAGEEETAVAYVHKEDLFNELKQAIRAIQLGNIYISRTFRQKPWKRS